MSALLQYRYRRRSPRKLIDRKRFETVRFQTRARLVLCAAGKGSLVDTAPGTPFFENSGKNPAYDLIFSRGCVILCLSGRRRGRLDADIGGAASIGEVFMDEHVLKRQEQTKKRWGFVVDCLYFGIIIGLFYFLANTALSVIFPFLFAFFFAVVLQRPVNFLTKKTKLPKALWSVLLVLLLFFAVLLVFVFVIMRLVTEFKSFYDYMAGVMQEVDLKDWLSESVAKWLAFLPDSIEKAAVSYLQSLIAGVGSSGGENPAGGLSNLTGILSKPLSGIFSTAKQIPSFLIATVVAVVTCCFATSGYDGISAAILRQFRPDRAQKIKDAKRLIFVTFKKMFKAYSLIMLITGTEVYVTLRILSALGLYKGGYLVVISILTAIVDIVPVLGTGTVFIPWAVYSLFAGNIGFGIGMLVAYGIMTALRQVIEPKLVAGQVGLSPVVTIMAMYIGGRVFGAFGIFILPITVIFIKLMNDEGIIKLLKRESDPVEAAADADETADADDRTDAAGDSEPAGSDEPGDQPSPGDK